MSNVFRRKKWWGWAAGPDEPLVTISRHTVGIHRRNCVTWIPQSPYSSETYILVGEEKLPKGNDFKIRTKPDVPAVFGKLRQIFCKCPSAPTKKSIWALRKKHLVGAHGLRGRRGYSLQI